MAGLRGALSVPRLECYIGLIYLPATESWNHYSRASLPDHYDAFTWFNESRAVTSLPATLGLSEDETYPFVL